MCYKGGPRCSSEAERRLARAKKVLSEQPDSAVAQEKYVEALFEWGLTKKGLLELGERVDVALVEFGEGSAEYRRAVAELERARDAREALLRENKGRVAEHADLVGETERVYVLREGALDHALNQVAVANRKLERAGIDDRFTYDIETRHEVEDVDGVPTYVTRHSLTLHTPVIKLAGHEFQAVASMEDGGMVVNTVPGVELGGWRPESMGCDHCGQSRVRAKTYLVKTPDGDLKQVGSTCLEAYLGVTPRGLWALQYELEPQTEDEGRVSGRRGGEPPKYDKDFVLRVALTVTDEGTRYVSRKAAEEREQESTSERIRRVLSGPGLSDAEERWRQGVLRKAEKYEGSELVDEVKSRINDLPDGTDYSANLKTINAGLWTTPRTTAVYASAVTLLRTREERPSEPIYTQGHWGQVNEKIPKGTQFEVVKNVAFGDYDYHGNPITKSRLTLKSPEGHQIVWFASKEIEADEGGTVTINSGRVKKHGQYNGVDQTVVTNLRLA